RRASRVSALLRMAARRALPSRAMGWASSMATRAAGRSPPGGSGSPASPRQAPWMASRGLLPRRRISSSSRSTTEAVAGAAMARQARVANHLFIGEGLLHQRAHLVQKPQAGAAPVFDPPQEPLG